MCVYIDISIYIYLYQTTETMLLGLKWEHIMLELKRDFRNHLYQHFHFNNAGGKKAQGKVRKVQQALFNPHHLNYCQKTVLCDSNFKWNQRNKPYHNNYWNHMLFFSRAASHR